MVQGDVTVSWPALRDALKLRPVRWWKFGVSIEVTDELGD